MFATIHPDDLASEIAAHEPYNFFATADREEHYLFAAGFRTSCGCSRCEAEQEAVYAEEDAKYQQVAWEAQVDAMTHDELDQLAARDWRLVELGWEQEFRLGRLGLSWDECPF